MRLLVVVAIVAGCSKTAQPVDNKPPIDNKPAPTNKVPGPSAASCAADADCALVNAQPPECCSRCSSTAVTAAQAAAVAKECSERAAKSRDYFAHCPHLDCPCEKQTARCRKGACVVENTECH